MREDEVESMGKQAVVDKTVQPMSTTTLTNLTPALVTAGAAYNTLGVLPIGMYKGAAAFWDLNLGVNEPNVVAEAQHILGNLDGATATVDLAAIVVPAATVAGTVITTTITVPAGEVWFINCITGTCAADATGTIVYNWRCLLFPDAAANVLGGVYHTAWLATALGPQLDEFGAIATVFAVGNKPVLLRLPAATTISGQLMNAAGAAAATGVTGTMQLFGYRGKALVL